MFGSVVSLHYKDTLFKFLFHLEGKHPIKTALKFQQYFPIVNKVTYLLPKFLTVRILRFVQIWWFLLKGNVRYRPSKLDQLFSVIPCRFKTWWVLFWVIPRRRFMLLLINTYVKFERCISSFGKEIALEPYIWYKNLLLTLKVYA